MERDVMADVRFDMLVSVGVGGSELDADVIPSAGSLVLSGGLERRWVVQCWRRAL